MKARHKFEVYADILKVSLFGTRKTYLMGQARLSFPDVVKNLKVLVERELLKEIEETPQKTLYVTTVKGQRFLKFYHKFVGFLAATLFVCWYACNNILR